MQTFRDEDSENKTPSLYGVIACAATSNNTCQGALNPSILRSTKKNSDCFTIILNRIYDNNILSEAFQFPHRFYCCIANPIDH